VVLGHGPGETPGTPLAGTAADWQRSSEALNRLLVEEAAEWWVAELPASRQLVGFARSIERDGLFELTEFFVLPDRQSRGIGRALIERSFPLDVVTSGRSSRHRTCEPRPATTRPGRSPASLSSPWVALRPSQCQVHDLMADPIEGPQAIRAQREIERSVLGHRRFDTEVNWLLARRQGHSLSAEPYPSSLGGAHPFRKLTPVQDQRGCSRSEFKVS